MPLKSLQPIQSGSVEGVPPVRRRPAQSCIVEYASIRITRRNHVAERSMAAPEQGLIDRAHSPRPSRLGERSRAII